VADPAAGATTDRWSASDSRRWPAEAEQLAAIRAEVHGWLAPLGLSDDTEQDIVLAVSEVATNAIEHAYPPGDADAGVELAFRMSGGSICIEIVDHGTWREPATESGGRGFGLPLIRRLVRTVTVEHDVRGTRVVLQHPLDPPNGHAGLAAVAPEDGTGRR
jgi:serine/threonine-protein kinase RsbW